MKLFDKILNLMLVLVIGIYALSWANSEFGWFEKPAMDAEAATSIAQLDVAALDRQLQASRQPTLIFLFAQWCPVCRQQYPVIDALAREHQGKLTVIGVSVDEDPGKLASFLSGKPQPIPFDVKRSPDNMRGFIQSLRARGSTIGNGIPYSMLLAPGGSMAAEFKGGTEKAEFDAALAPLLQ